MGKLILAALESTTTSFEWVINLHETWWYTYLPAINSLQHSSTTFHLLIARDCLCMKKAEPKGSQKSGRNV